MIRRVIQQTACAFRRRRFVVLFLFFRLEIREERVPLLIADFQDAAPRCGEGESMSARVVDEIVDVFLNLALPVEGGVPPADKIPFALVLDLIRQTVRRRQIVLVRERAVEILRQPLQVQAAEVLVLQQQIDGVAVKEPDDMD